MNDPTPRTPSVEFKRRAFARRALIFGVVLAASLVASIGLFLSDPTHRIGGVAVFALLQFLVPIVGAAYACFLASWALSDRVPRRAAFTVAAALLAAAGYSLIRCWPTLLGA